jgi:hypothetical protein
LIVRRVCTRGGLKTRPYYRLAPISLFIPGRETSLTRREPEATEVYVLMYVATS